jgi:hypothetical protein
MSATQPAGGQLTSWVEPVGHLTAGTHRPALPPGQERSHLLARPRPRRPTAIMVDRRYFQPRVYDPGLPLNN